MTAIVKLKRLHKDKDAGPITLFDATGPSFTGGLLAIPLSAPAFSFQRKPIRPRRQLAHQVAQPLDGTESFWNFGCEFVMHMQDDGIPVRLNVDDCVRQQIAGYSLCQVLGQLPAVQLLHPSFVVDVLDYLCRSPVFLDKRDFGRS